MNILKNKISIILICVFLFYLVFNFLIKDDGKNKKINLSREKCSTKDFLIAPMIGGVSYTLSSDDISIKINHSLKEIKTNKVNDSVKIGYNLGIPLLSLFQKQGNNFVIDENKVNFYLNIIKKTNYPVVIQLMSNHFTPKSDLTEFLKTDKNNFMFLQNNEMPKSTYFSTEILPFTLSVDESIPVNKYRFEALKYVLKKLKEIDDEDSSIIKAITLNGEVHHLFDGLEEKTGNYENILVTDYSKKSIDNFKEWSKKKYSSINMFNKENNTYFKNFDSIQPPYQNIKNNNNEHNIWTHFDSFANGEIPIFGWTDIENPKIEIYLDDKFIDYATYGLNRMDVYQNIEKIKNPNLGFRYNLKYSNIEPGVHKIDVFINKKLLASKKIIIKNQKNNITDKTYFNKQNNNDNTSGWLDSPIDNELFLYNKYASLWQDFREDQTSLFLKKIYDISLSTNFNKNKIYSHQLIPELNGSWNDLLFSSEKTLDNNSEYNIGINLYGGLTENNLVTQKINNRKFGSPEFNPQTYKSVEEFLSAIKYQYNNCSEFISPYYLGISEKIDTSKNGEFDLRNQKSSMGSKYFYEAIKKLSVL